VVGGVVKGGEGRETGDGRRETGGGGFGNVYIALAWAGASSGCESIRPVQ